jgi:uncharacterized protein (TIGR00251 family)
MKKKTKQNSRMLLRVRVIPRSKKNEVIDMGNNRVKVNVISPPVDGRANRELIESLAQHYKKKKSSITIKKGTTSRNKLVEIAD